ncbi:MAG: hypothetical protein WC595_00880 [Candidatus Nanoarchaeia archaeon]
MDVNLPKKDETDSKNEASQKKNFTSQIEILMSFSSGIGAFIGMFSMYFAFEIWVKKESPNEVINGIIFAVLFVSFMFWGRNKVKEKNFRTLSLNSQILTKSNTYKTYELLRKRESSYLTPFFQPL